jgi:hypothetical protein
MGNQTPLPRLVLSFEEQGIAETDLPLVAYGDMLFDSPQIFGDPARSLGIACSTCHNRSDVNRDLFIPGISHQPGAIDVDGATSTTSRTICATIRSTSRACAACASPGPTAATAASPRSGTSPATSSSASSRAPSRRPSCSTRSSPTCSSSISCRTPGWSRGVG